MLLHMDVVYFESLFCFAIFYFTHPEKDTSQQAQMDSPRLSSFLFPPNVNSGCLPRIRLNLFPRTDPALTRSGQIIRPLFLLHNIIYCVFECASHSLRNTIQTKRQTSRDRLDMRTGSLPVLTGRPWLQPEGGISDTKDPFSKVSSLGRPNPI